MTQCDLVLLSWNRPDLLKPCVERILTHTRLPSRLIIVDNASTDLEALQFIDRAQGNDSVELSVVRRSQNDGFAKGMNEGLSHTNAPWICLINNDILVTEGWLSQMLEVAQTHPKIGLLNPMSNEFNLSPRPGETIDALAQRLSVYQGQWIENWAGVAFCLLFPRRILEKVGPLDEEFRFMYFEDTDYSLRVREAGFTCGIARGAYVYHHGGASAKLHPAREQIFRENEERFYRKWPLVQPQRIAWVLPQAPPLSSLEQLQSRIRRLANEGHKVWVFCTSDAQGAIPDHIRVHPIVLSKVLFPFLVVWRVVFKKKKFHRIIWEKRSLSLSSS